MCDARQMPSRIAGSVSIAAGVPETVVSSLAAYEAVAVRLLTNATELAALRTRLTTAIWARRPPASAPFFNNAAWIDHWERGLYRAFQAAYRNHTRAAAPSP